MNHEERKQNARLQFTDPMIALSHARWDRDTVEKINKSKDYPYGLSCKWGFNDRRRDNSKRDN